MEPFLDLDHAATAPLEPDIREKFLAALDQYGNPSSLHAAGRRARDALEGARSKLAQHFEVLPDWVTFCSGATEANLLALQSLDPKAHVLASPIEHSSLREPLRARFSKLEWLQAGADGEVKVEGILAKRRPETRAIVLMAANNESGVIQPLRELRESLSGNPNRPLVVCDAVQALWTEPLPELARSADFLTMSGHKIGAPKGIGALIAAPNLVSPLLLGGGQEDGRRAGTENLAGAVTLAAAVEIRPGKPFRQQLRASRDNLERSLRQLFSNLVVHGAKARRLPGHLFFSIPGLSGEALVAWLDEAGIAASTGAACSSARDEPSPVLVAMGCSEELCRGSLRFSLPGALSADEIQRVCRSLAAAAAHLGRIAGAP